MNRIEWSEHFSTGHARTDEQHKEIISRCNAMMDYISSGDIRRCAQTFADCLLSCERHFVEESELLKTFDDIDPSEHFTDHQDILVRLKAMKRKCRDVCSGQECVSEVFHTIVSHMLKHDLKIRQNFID
jgi:hemerythrin-like metal-binding protein